MSYIINKTDGTTLTEIVDGAIDQTATDLTLIGKNSSSYGEFVNENYVHILENFANVTSPNNPITGQLWFDTSEGRLKIYDGTGFKVSGGTIVSHTPSSSLAVGDLWIDSFRRQLYFYDGISTLLAGPGYTEQQGISGFQTVDVDDIAGNSRTIVLLYVSTVLLGIYSKDAFTPGTAIAGFAGDIKIGFNSSNYSGSKFNVVATHADALVDPSDKTKSYNASDFLITTEDTTITGTVTIQHATPLVLGAGSNSELNVTSNSFNINSNTSNQNFKINLLSNMGLETALSITAATRRVGIYTTHPSATLDVNGDVIIRGSLTVEGNLTTINTTNVAISDKLIELAKTEFPSNVSADGGGISVVAGGFGNDKTIKWDNGTTSWVLSDNVNIPTGKTFKINGFDVLSTGSLGGSVTNSSLTNVGILTELQVDSININNSTIRYLNVAQARGDIILKPKGTGSVDISNAAMINVADPIDNTSAVNLNTLTRVIESTTLVLSLETTGLTDGQIASIYLEKVFPESEHRESTLCRVICRDTGIVTIKLYQLTSGIWLFQTFL